MNKTVLITGGAGYIGSHAVKAFLKAGYQVVIFDNLSHGYIEAVEFLKTYGNCEFVKGDLKNKDDIAQVFHKYSIDGVIHFAALCSVDESMRRPELYFENNVLGTLNLLEAMKGKTNKIIFSSTCAVYGETVYLPVDEKHPTNPKNPYGESKLMAERIIGWYGSIHGFRYNILRYFNVCGADAEGKLGDSKRPSVLLVQNAVRGAMGLEAFEYTCPKVATLDGTPIRDYVDVEDLVAAHLKAYENLDLVKESRVINLGSGTGYSVKEVIAEVENVFGIIMPQKNGAPRQGEYAAIYANNSLAKELLGWKPIKNLKQSILSLKKWYEGHPNGFK